MDTQKKKRMDLIPSPDLPSSAAPTAAAAVAIREAVGAAQMEGGGGERRRNIPTKRAVALAAFLACLSFLMFSLNVVITFCRDLIENEIMWKSLYAWMSRYENCTKEPDCVPSLDSLKSLK